MRWLKFLFGDISPDRFARRVAKLVTRENPALMPVYQREDFRLKCANDTSINLHNVYRDFLASPRSARADMLCRFVKSLVDTPAVPDQFGEVRHYLRPAIRPRALLEYLRLQGMLDNAKPLDIPHRILGEDAMIVLMVDSERAMSLVSSEHLAKWGVSFDSAMEIAEINLRESAPDKFARPDASVTLISGDWNDGYDSSRILFADLLHRAIDTGFPVAMVPTRDALLIAPRNSASAQLAMVNVASVMMANSSRMCSAQMFQVTANGLEGFEPDDEAARAALRNLQRESLKAAYDDQKEQLDRVHEKQNEDIFVASYILGTKDGKVDSLCSWTEGITAALLPATEKVALVRPCGDDQPDIRIVDWNEIRGRAGHLMKPTGTYPLRYFVSAFPTDVFLEAGTAAPGPDQAPGPSMTH